MSNYNHTSSNRLCTDHVLSRPDPGPVSVPVSGRNRRSDGSGSCEPNLNRILNGSWAVPVLSGSGSVPVRFIWFRSDFFFLIYIDKINKINC